MNNTALVLFSGGQDSTTCLFWAKERFKQVVALNIFYGQRHSIEVSSAKEITKLAGVQLIDFQTDIFKQIGDSTLLRKGNISSTHRGSDKLPASFVPGRNIIFLTIAGAIAFKKGIKDIVTGVCQTDYSGYPDCRDLTIKTLERTLSLGMDYQFKIHTPLMFIDKASTVRLAKKLEGCWKALSFSHTCYEGVFPPCDKCSACLLRAKGFKEANIEDPLIRRAKNEGLL